MKPTEGPLFRDTGDHWLSRAIATAGVVAYACDLRSGRVQRSPNSMTALGLSSDGDAADWLEVIVPEDRAYYLAAIGSLIPSAPTFEVEYRVRHLLTGIRFWVLDRGEARFDEQGGRIGLEGVLTDINVRNRADEEPRPRARFSTIEFAAARMGAWHYDPVHGVISCSDELLGMVGLTRDGFDGRISTFETVLHPDDVTLWKGTDEGPFLADDSFEVEFRGRGAGGEVRWFLSRGEVARRMDGTVIESYGVMIDITARKKAEQAAAHLAALVASSEDAIISKTVTGIVTSWNRGAERLFGYSAVEMIGASITRILHEKDAEEEARILDTISRGETIAAYESVRLHKDGTPVHISLTVSPILDGMGRVVGASTIARDLTDRLQHLERLRNSESRLRLAMRGARAGAWDYDVIHHRMHWSQEMFELYGLDLTAGVPDDAGRLALIEPTHRQRVEREFQAALNEGRSIAIEFPILRPDGRETWTAMYGDVLLDPAGFPRAAYGISQDVTERKMLEKRQAVLLRELSHRVKNSLAIILSIARQTLHAHNDPRAFVEAFEGRVRSLAQSHNLLTEGEIASARVGDIIRGQLTGIVGNIDDRLEINGTDLALPAEQATQLGLILHELATNAVKHGSLSADGGRVVIQWLASRGRLCLTWIECGGPPILSPPAKTGFGTRLIDASCKRVSRRFERSGLRARFELQIQPAPQSVPG